VLTLAMLGAVGFAAQLVNTGLGMGYGVSSTTVLLALGTGPAVAAATVNVSQVGSQLVSGVAHWRLGNVDWAVVWRIALPGAAGAFTGATLLSWLSTKAAGPVVAGVLLGLGLFLLVRFHRHGPNVRPATGPAVRPLRARFLAPLGLVGGFLNSTGGGGWGPVGTSALLATGRLAPRTVIGSISAAEAAVVLAGSAGFALGLGLAGIHLHWAAAMLAGGLIAAPVAAGLAARVPAHLLGVLVGGLIVVINLRALLYGDWHTLPGWVRAAVLAAGVLLWAGAIVRTVRRHQPARGGVPEPAGP
jgi:uncharacterized protein